MNGQWLSNTRKLNHHYQSGAKRYLRAYMYINNQHEFSGCPYYFTPNGVRIDCQVRTRTFIKVNDATITDNYLPLMIIPERIVSCAGVTFRTLDLENSAFTCDNLDIIVRSEELKCYSAIDNSYHTMNCLVVLINTAELSLYTDNDGVVWWSNYDIATRIGHNVRILFTDIDEKIAIVGETFEVKMTDIFYFHSIFDSSTYEQVPGTQRGTPKNLNNLKKGTLVRGINYKINKARWEATVPSSNYDSYYGMKWSIQANTGISAPFESIAPNAFGQSNVGNFLLVPSGNQFECYWYDKNNRVTRQFRNVPDYLQTRQTGAVDSGTTLRYTSGEASYSWSNNGKFLCMPNTPSISIAEIYGRLVGEDWSLNMSQQSLIPNPIAIRTYGTPILSGGSGSTFYTSHLSDKGENIDSIVT